MSPTYRALLVSGVLLLLLLVTALGLQRWVNTQSARLQRDALADAADTICEAAALAPRPPEQWDEAYRTQLGGLINGRITLTHHGEPAAPRTEAATKLEFVRELHGVCWYNDSIATAPERSIAAIHSFTEPIVLMLGGRDKNLPWDDLAKLIHQRVDHLVVFGEAGEMIQKAVTDISQERSAVLSSSKGVDIRQAKNLKEAIGLAHEVASNGDVVLLSPGCTSFDEFKDFAERGERFCTWVQELS